MPPKLYSPLLTGGGYGGLVRARQSALKQQYSNSDSGQLGWSQYLKETVDCNAM